MAEINWNALRTPDFAGDAIAAGQQGRNDGLSLAKQNALRQYSTDPDGGIRALMAVDPATAVALQKAQAEQQQQASQVQAGQAAASGDLEGAARIAGGAGNFELMSQIQGMSKEQRTVASQAYGELASVAQSVKALPYEQRKAAIQQQAPRLQALGLKPEQIAAFDPTDQGIDGFVQSSLGLKGQIDQSNKDREFGLQTNQFGETQRHNKADEGHAAATAAEAARHNKADEGVAGARLHEEVRHNQASEGDTGGLDPNGVDYVAQQYMLTGNLPPMGFGKAGAAMRQQVIQRAAQIESETGATGADAVQRHAQVKAAMGSLNKVTGQRGMIEAFETTARANGQQVRDLLTKGAGPATPWFNKPIQALRQNGLGDANVSALNSAITAYTGEVAKIISGSSGSQGSTDAMRRETAKMLDPNATPQQILASMAVLDKDMGNRSTGLRQQESALAASIRNPGGGSAGQPAAQPPPAAGVIRYDAQGHRIQ